MAKSRWDLRREAEAAEELEKTKPTKKKAAKRKATTRRAREKAPERKRAVWVVFDGSMKEHGRYAYDQKEAAEEKLESLRQRGTKKMYFLQMVKELLTADAPPVSSALTSVTEEDDPINEENVVKKKKPSEDEDGLDVSFEDSDFTDDDDEEDDDDDDDEMEEE